MNDTDKLLHKAHLIINDATGTDIPQDVLDKAKEKARRIYNQIKTINPDVYERIKIDLKK
jgi:acyl CoA:acetate/3-ketoacid CoA transferase|tara:strand:- start:630 stop:809 length:180 start_codon:yes stop_codon:yes gene_type:complete